MTLEGVIVIHAREHRTQEQNREAARERLAALLAKAAQRPKRRADEAVGHRKEKRLASKHRRSETNAPGARTKIKDSGH